jgi:hypothetical protein
LKQWCVLVKASTRGFEGEGALRLMGTQGVSGRARVTG